MGKNIVMFIIFFALGLGGGYLIFGNNNDDVNEQVATEKHAQTEDREQTDESAGDENETVMAEAAILNERGCVSCHSISALNLQGGATGPDLSQAYVNVEQKHGLPIEEYLKNPTSAVMSSVIAGDPLTEEELDAVVEALRIASEK